MGVTIESAYLGDERSRVNVTSSLQAKASSNGNYSVPVDSSLLPFTLVSEKIELTKDEESNAQKRAAKDCGNPNDKQCVDAKTAEYKRERLEEKEREAQAASTMIKGRRLTVKFIDNNGKRQIMEIPEGGKFETGPAGPVTPKFEVRKSLIPDFSLIGAMFGVSQYVAVFLGSILYVLSIFITFMSFKAEGFGYWTYLPTAIAAFIPYSGFLITFTFFFGRTWIQNMPFPK